jgi:hypothetical protein
MRDSTRYREQAEAVRRLAARAHGRAEREVYLTIAEGWERLAREAERNEKRGPEEKPARR